MFRYVSMFMLLIFLLSMAVQYNDPDPIRWIAIYGVCAVFAGLAIRGIHHWLSIPVAVAYIAGVLYWMPGTPIDNPMNLMTDVKMVNLGVEEWREDGGLLICAVWMIVLSVVWFVRRKKSQAPVNG
jgi:hypothetical protein